MKLLVFEPLRRKIVFEIYKPFYSMFGEAEGYVYGYMFLRGLSEDDMEKLRFNDLFRVLGYKKHPTNGVVLKYVYRFEFTPQQADSSGIYLDLRLVYERDNEKVSYLDFLVGCLMVSPSEIDEVSGRLRRILEDALANAEKMEKWLAAQWRDSKIGSAVILQTFL